MSMGRSYACFASSVNTHDGRDSCGKANVHILYESTMSMGFRVASFVVFCAVCVMAQHPVPELHSHGRSQYERFCATCHGGNAKGARGPDLTGALRHGPLPSDMVQSILAGIPGTQMPSFSMPRSDAEAIAAYLFHLRNPKDEGPVTGNVTAGSTLFLAPADVAAVICTEAREEG